MNGTHYRVYSSQEETIALAQCILVKVDLGKLFTLENKL